MALEKPRRASRRRLTITVPRSSADAYDDPAFLFEDHQTPGDWHVQWTDDEGGFEMAIFSGPRAHERAIMFAERCYGSYEQVRTDR